MSQTFTLTWFLGQEVLGTAIAPVHQKLRKASQTPFIDPINWHLFCPNTGRIWCSIISSVSDRYEYPNRTKLLKCPEQGGNTIIPNEVCYWDYFDILTGPVLQYEFLLKTQPTKPGVTIWLPSRSH